ncbi:MotE family protein [Brevundimonas sp. SORGH_AS_0993]|uniref:MotE family protein n=1 Tax=Brevundimonas sp. SORGH_AS_0993 TaxID=3041794 RepID=UPI0027870AA4|nr:MotE family protein [Brevundimonas sp. SORGH_AS_0993]MDQ1154064.1 flagellar motility protein MotE (MotC chaperone) [Brevundimonas sp. SORGH_AS_0993]
MARIPRILPLIAVAIGGVVAVRAVGLAPGLFDGAKAWAEDAATSAAAAGGAPKPVLPTACALTPEQLAQQAGISPAELKIIQSLSQRRSQLDARDQDFATTLPLMVAAEQKLDAKVKALEALKVEMKQMLGQVDEREKAEIDRLVQVYSAMRPKDAAPVMASLEDRVRLPVAAAMRPRTLAAIMSQMTPPQARELTEKLAARFQAQQMAARAAAAEAATPPPQPTPAQNTSPAAAPTATPAANATPSAATPGARTAQSRPASRPAARPPARRPAPKPAAATPAPTTPQPYQPSAAANAQPRQTVQ